MRCLCQTLLWGAGVEIGSLQKEACVNLFCRSTRDRVCNFIYALARIEKGVAPLQKIHKQVGITNTEGADLLSKMQTVPGIKFVNTDSGRLQTIRLSKINSGCNSAVWNSGGRQTTFYKRGIAVNTISDSDVKSLWVYRQELFEASKKDGIPFFDAFCELEQLANFYGELVCK